MYKLSKYAVTSEPFCEINTGTAKQVVFSGTSSEARVIHPDILAYLNRQEIKKIPADVLNELLETSIIVEDSKTEATQVLDENRKFTDKEETLYHVIAPSAWCQLGCGYCGQAHEKKAMGDKNLQAIYQSIADSLHKGDFKHLHIGWFGGEPLTGLTIIDRFSRQLKQLTDSLGLGYSAKVVTNGLALTPKVFRQLSALDVIHYEVTLDGPEQTHDQSRPTKAGAGSYLKILSNLEAILPIIGPNKITIRVNVGIDNVKAIPKLLTDLSAIDLQRAVNIYFAPLHNWGNAAGDKALAIEDFAQYELGWYAMLLEMGFDLGLIPTRKKQVCMSLSPTSNVYDAYGDIFNCSELFQVPSYGTPNQHRLGNLNLIASTSKPRLYADFNDKIENKETTCKECYCLPVCGGACPKSWDEGNIPCPSFKFNFKQRLLLQYASKVKSQRSAAQ